MSACNEKACKETAGLPSDHVIASMAAGPQRQQAGPLPTSKQNHALMPARTCDPCGSAASEPRSLPIRSSMTCGDREAHSARSTWRFKLIGWRVVTYAGPEWHATNILQRPPAPSDCHVSQEQVPPHLVLMRARIHGRRRCLGVCNWGVNQAGSG